MNPGPVTRHLCKVPGIGKDVVMWKEEMQELIGFQLGELSFETEKELNFHDCKVDRNKW